MPGHIGWVSSSSMQTGQCVRPAKLTPITSTSMFAPLPGPRSCKSRSVGADTGFFQLSGQRRRVVRQRTGLQLQAALLDPPPFDPAKLTVRYLPCLPATDATVPGRRYTLTHNDITGNLTLSIGAEYNRAQLSGWYTRILRDEVLAEWHVRPADDTTRTPALPVLHVYCHVSGEEAWPAPPSLRSFIFQREMTLVLDTILYADRALLAADVRLSGAAVVVHLVSDLVRLNRVIEWGVLGDRATWPQKAPGDGIFQQVVSSILSSFSSMDEEYVEIPEPPSSSDNGHQQQQQQEQGTGVSEGDAAGPSSTVSFSNSLLPGANIGNGSGARASCSNDRSSSSGSGSIQGVTMPSSGAPAGSLGSWSDGECLSTLQPIEARVSDRNQPNS